MFPPLRPYLAFRPALLSFLHLPLKIRKLTAAGWGTHTLPESIKLYQTKPGDHTDLVKVTARCWVWKEFLAFLCRMEHCPLPNLISGFPFSEFPNVARAQHISLVPLWHVIASETWRNSNSGTLKFFGVYWYGPYGPTVHTCVHTVETVCCKITCSHKKGDLVTQMVPSGTKFSEAVLGDLQLCPRLAPSFVKLHHDKAWAHRLFPKQAPGTFLSW